MPRPTPRAVRRPRVTGRPRLTTFREEALRAAWTSGDDELRLTPLEVAVILGWSASTVRLHVRTGRMPAQRLGPRTDSRRPWTVSAGDLRLYYTDELARRRRDASTDDAWI